MSARGEKSWEGTHGSSAWWLRFHTYPRTTVAKEGRAHHDVKQNAKGYGEYQQWLEGRGTQLWKENVLSRNIPIKSSDCAQGSSALVAGAVIRSARFERGGRRLMMLQSARHNN